MKKEILNALIDWYMELGEEEPMPKVYVRELEEVKSFIVKS